MEGTSAGEMSTRRWLPPGFRFHPTDEELITYYLARKIEDESFSDDAITELDLNRHEPWDLPGKAKMMGDKVWYFFSVKDRKYPLGCRTNRATRAGYWKATGKDKEVFMSCKSTNTTSAISPLSSLQKQHMMGPRDKLLVGMKKTLVFYQGRAPKGLKSNWVMHEYRLHEHAHVASMTNIKQHEHRNQSNGYAKEQTWVLCRVFHKRKLPESSNISCAYPNKPSKLISSTSHLYNDMLAYLDKSNVVGDCDWLPPLKEQASTEAVDDEQAINQVATAAVASSYEGGHFLAEQLPDVAALPPNYLADQAKLSTTTASTPCSNSTQYDEIMNNAHNYQIDNDNNNSDKISNGSVCPYQYQYNSTILSGVREADNYMFKSDGSAYHTISNHSLPRFPSELESLWLHTPSFFV